MSIADPEKALSLVEEFRDLLVKNRTVYDQQGDEASRAHPTHQALLRKSPLVERIAADVDPEAQIGLGVAWAGMWSWEGRPRRVERVIGILSQWEDHKAVLSSRGPTLASGQLHPWVRDAAADLWGGGHHGSAVHAAAKAVEHRVQLKLGRNGLDGKDLYARAFSTKPPRSGEPRLRFPGVDKAKQAKAWTSAHEGAMHFGMGCAQGIRNPRAHSSEDVSEQEAAEQLAALSVLARWADASVVESA